MRIISVFVLWALMLPRLAVADEPTRELAFESGQGNSRDIYLINADGTHLRQLTDFPGWEDMVAWSPDGKYITVIADFTGVKNLYVLEVDSLSWTPLTDLPAGAVVSSGLWSPDGTQIAMMLNLDGTYQVYIISPDGTGMQQLTHKSQASYLEGWSSDGQQLLITHQPDINTNSELFWLEIVTGEMTQITDTDAPELLLRQSFQISGDASLGMYNSQQGDVFSVDLQTGQVEQLTPSDFAHFSGEAVWSPDEKQIVYLKTVDFPAGRPPLYALYLMDLASGEVQEMKAAGSAYGGVEPQWAVDGQQLAFSQFDGTDAEICLLNMATQVLQCLTNNAVFDGYPLWRPD